MTLQPQTYRKPVAKATTPADRAEDRRIGNLFYRYGKRGARKAKQALYGSNRLARSLGIDPRPPAPPPRRCYRPQGMRRAASNDGEVANGQ